MMPWQILRAPPMPDPARACSSGHTVALYYYADGTTLYFLVMVML